MSNETLPCLYCKNDDPGKFRGVEHVIPQAFGTYGAQTPVLKFVCDDCNGYFGTHLDTYLARETIEGITRYKKGIYSEESRPQRYLQITLEDRPENGWLAGMKVKIDGTTGDLMGPVPQFIIRNKVTGKLEAFLASELNDLKVPEDIYGKPGNGSTTKGTWDCKVIAPTKPEYDEIVGILNSNGIAYVPGQPFAAPESMTSDQDGQFMLSVLIEGEINERHRQAHAKIFMNILASRLGYNEAIAPHWDFLRRYARYGEGSIKYRVAEEQVLPDEQEGKLKELIGDSIIVQVHNSKNDTVGTIRFYGNQTYQYILRADATLTDDKKFSFMFTAGAEPVLL